jgi:uncharacterized membrane protein YdjX (TVP38/TMEM64 family)
MNKKLKVILGVFYLACLVLLLYAFFTFLDFKRINDYSYIRDNTQILMSFKNQNLIAFIFLFFISGIVWVLLLGFGSPIALVSGFIFGKFIGTIICVLSLSVGSTLLYIFAKLYFKELITKHLSHKILKFKNLFNKNEFLYFLLFRFAGGGGIPFALQNILPTIFDMKNNNYFYATLFGLVPTTFIINSLGSGIEKVIEENKEVTMFEVISDPAIYFPIIGFILILAVSYFVKNKIFKK